jgi:hypothetical protein
MLIEFRLLIVMLMVTALTACGGGGSSSDGGGSTPPNGSDEPGGSDGPDDPDGPETPDFTALNSGGAVVINSIRASRTDCVSPCTVVFSADDVQDTTSSTDNDWYHLGYYWDYGDSNADETLGIYQRGADYFRNNSNGASREFDTTPLGAHTYLCDEGTCTFNAGLAVRNSVGDWATDWATITVRSQSVEYPDASTVCVSNTSVFTDCPQGARQTTELPDYGAWENDTRYLISAQEVHSLEGKCIEFDTDNILISSYGTGSYPTLSSRLNVGSDSSSCRDITPNDEAVANYSNPWWISNITITKLRVHDIQINSSFRNIGLHDLDMDWEDEASGGGIRTSSVDFCTDAPSLTCSNVPLPYGVYISDVVSIGSRTSPPGTNIGFWTTSGVSYIAFINSLAYVAAEHNFRAEGASRVIVSHSDFLGDHFAAGKHKITVRPEGSLNADMLNQMRVPSDDQSAVYDSRYVAILDNYLGTPASIGNGSAITLKPTNAGAPEVVRWGVVDNNTFDLSGGLGDGPSTYDIRLAGYDLGCYTTNDEEAPQGCADAGQEQIPAEGYNVRLFGEKPIAPRSPVEYSAPE